MECLKCGHPPDGVSGEAQRTSFALQSSTSRASQAENASLAFGRKPLHLDHPTLPASGPHDVKEVGDHLPARQWDHVVPAVPMDTL